jgi:hypothetical protein
MVMLFKITRDALVAPGGGLRGLDLKVWNGGIEYAGEFF